MTTASDECAGTHRHQADENLQNNTRNGGGAIDPANTRTDGEKILPQLVHAIILRHSDYEQRELINSSDIWDFVFEYIAFFSYVQGHSYAVQQVVTISPGYVTMSYTLYTQFKEIVDPKNENSIIIDFFVHTTNVNVFRTPLTCKILSFVNVT